MTVKFRTNIDKYKSSMFPSFTDVPRKGDKVSVSQDYIKTFAYKSLPTELEVVAVTWYDDCIICELHYSKLDIDFPIVDTSETLGIPNSNRVMPMNKMGKMFSLLKAKTKTFKDADISHFWVSGYIQLFFYLKSKEDRKKIKKLVTDAVELSGGFMTLEEWHSQHTKEKGRMKIFAYQGSGANITGGQINTGYEYL